MIKRVFLIIIITAILCPSFLYTELVFNLGEELYLKGKLVDFYDKEKILLEYELPYTETLFLKVKTPKSVPIKTVIFNDNIIKSHQINLRGVIYTHNIYIPQEFVFAGTNNLTIYFQKPKDLKRIAELYEEGWQIDTRLYNFRKKISDNLTILFSDNHIFENKDFITKILLVIFLFSFFCFILNETLFKVLTLPVAKIYRNTILLLLVPNIFLALAYFILIKFKFRIIITGGYLLAYFIIFQLVEIILLGVIIFFKFFKGPLGVSRIGIRGIFIHLNELWKANPKLQKLSFPVLFICLLMMCALFLILRVEPVVKQLANIAYCILTLGVVVRFLKLIKKKKESE